MLLKILFLTAVLLCASSVTAQEYTNKNQRVQFSEELDRDVRGPTTSRNNSTGETGDPDADVDEEIEDGDDGSADSETANDLLSDDGDEMLTVAQIQANFSKICFVCPVAAHLFTAAITFPERVMQLAEGGGRNAFTNFLVIVLALWILWQVAKILLPFGVDGGMAPVGNNIFTRIILVSVVVLTFSATGYQLYWDYIYKPVVSGAVNFGYDIITQGSPEDSFLYESRYMGSDPDAGDRGCFATDMSAVAGMEDLPDGTRNEEHALKDKLECQIHTLQKAFTYGLSVGVYTFQKYQGSPNGMLSGGLLVVMFILPIILFSVMVIDALIKWTVISVLTPVLAGAACFQSTRKYAVIAYKSILEAGLIFIIAAIVAVLLSQMVHHAIIAVESDEALKGVLLGKSQEEQELIEAAEEGLDVEPFLDTPVVFDRGNDYQDAFASGVEGAKDFQTFFGPSPYVKAMDQKYRDIPLQSKPTATGGRGTGGQNNAGRTNWAFPVIGCGTKEEILANSDPDLHFWNAPRDGGTRPHRGLDLPCPVTSQVVSMQDGYVRNVIPSAIVPAPLDGCGWIVTVEFDNGYAATYCHLSAIEENIRKGFEEATRRGERYRVSKGTILGNVGGSGIESMNDYGPHLHLNLFEPGVGLINPYEIVYNDAEAVAGGTAAAAYSGPPPVSMLDAGWWYLASTGVVSKHAMMNIAPMVATLLGSPALAGIGMALFASMGALAGAGLKQGAGFAGGFLSPLAKEGISRSGLSGNVDAFLQSYTGRSDFIGQAARSMSMELAKWDVAAESGGGASIPRVEGAGEYTGMRDPYGELNLTGDADGNIRIGGETFDADFVNEMMQNPEETREFMDTMAAIGFMGGAAQAVSSDNLEDAEAALDQATADNENYQQFENELKERRASKLEERLEETLKDAEQNLQEFLDNAKDFDLAAFGANFGLAALTAVGGFAASAATGAVGGFQHNMKALGVGAKGIPGHLLKATVGGAFGLAGSGLMGAGKMIGNQIVGDEFLGAFGEELRRETAISRKMGNAVARDIVNRHGPRATDKKLSDAEMAERFKKHADDAEALKNHVKDVTFNAGLIEGSDLSRKEKDAALDNLRMAAIQSAVTATALTVAATYDKTARHEEHLDKLKAATNVSIADLKAAGVTVDAYEKRMLGQVRDYTTAVANDRKAKTIDAATIAAVGVASIQTPNLQSNAFNGVSGDIIKKTDEQLKDYKKTDLSFYNSKTNVDRVARVASNMASNTAAIGAGALSAMTTKQDWEMTKAERKERDRYEKLGMEPPKKGAIRKTLGAAGTIAGDIKKGKASERYDLMSEDEANESISTSAYQDRKTEAANKRNSNPGSITGKGGVFSAVDQPTSSGKSYSKEIVSDADNRSLHDSLNKRQNELGNKKEPVGAGKSRGTDRGDR